jgi:hypothetical protein
MLGAEQLAPDRSGKDVLADIGSKERREDAEGAARVERDGRLSLSSVGPRRYRCAQWDLKLSCKVYRR